MAIAFTLPRPVQARQALDWLNAHPRESLAGGLTTIAALVALGVIANPAGSNPRPLSPEERALAVAPPAALPMAVRDLAPQTALQINAAVPITNGPNPAARPFRAGETNSIPYARALECLTQAIYYEAARETVDGQRSVAQVILNRVRHPAYPSSVCGVVYQGSERDTGCQFTFTCDGSLYRAPMRSYWDRARQVAHEALQGYVHGPVGLATHYHTNYVVPYWASSLAKSAVVGTHIFYRWAGGWGRPPAFAQRYTGREADPYALKSASLAAEARDRATPNPATEVLVEAKQELPPELAKLVEAELGADGKARVGMRLDNPQGKDGSDSAAAATPDPARSANLNWTLTGAHPQAEQKPLGREEKAPVAETAAKPEAAVPAGAN